jgi:transcriptional regulator with XRE-family HTH domain
MPPTSSRSLAKRPSASLVDQICERSGLSQAELARRAGLPRSVVNVYARGHREPGTDVLARLAAAGGLDIGLAPRKSPVDVERASRILIQVLELAEALPFRPRAELAYPRLQNRLAAEGNGR